ncbi:uncharacterized protein LOC112084404 [Eutrema salsugineum]|uniref:uncharacterized protein LOC112084404 n=1 Tax=Eutrema salsugineum TaxID=72664 RepID=UPI000CECFB92|nr:uncharacterized protein LOC112084404 [Eutrema salsugineum]
MEFSALPKTSCGSFHQELAIPLVASVASACNAQGRRFRGARSPVLESFQIFLTTVPLPAASSSEDSFLWRANDLDLSYFSAKNTWSELRPRAPKHQYVSSVWFKGAIPRYAFTMWVSQLDRLSTRARLVKWGLGISSLCCLCDCFEENCDHLFLRCEVSEQLWDLVLIRLGYSLFAFHTWDAFMCWLSLRDTTSSILLCRIVALATIYSLWIERNNMFFNSVSTTPQAIFKRIDRHV